MRIFSPTRVRVAAGILALTFGLGGIAQAAQHRHAHHAAAKKTSVRHASLHHTHSRHAHSRHLVASHVIIGQRVMDPQRALEIQQALIQAHYLDGAPTGQWDENAQAAMQKYQLDNGWQTKITPDSRALIKLGLGPKQDEGEYAASAAGISQLPGSPLADPLRAMATSEIPATATEN
ncbi:MAG: peptidoglycan-binding domain-containing protein [Acidobacteriaceae bacterium]